MPMIQAVCHFEFPSHWSILLPVRNLTWPQRSPQAERLRVLDIGSVGGGRCHIIISISKTVTGSWTRQD